MRRSSQTWNDFLSRGKREFNNLYTKRVGSEWPSNEFEFIRTIGRGSFGAVVAAKSKEDIFYAIKILEKKNILEPRNRIVMLREKRMLWAIRFPFIIHMKHFFLDTTYLYYVMPFIAGGELFTLLRKEKKLDEGKAVFYAAQVVLALEFLHYLDVIYRDLKPENILLGVDGYIKLIDLGFAKVVLKRTYTFCGTSDYLAPEIILNRGYSYEVDWWALGVFVFEMCAGFPPFFSKNVLITYESILNASFSCPAHFSAKLRDILRGLMKVEISGRLGSLKDGVKNIKGHDWFKGIDWIDIFNRRIKAPIIPNIQFPGDTSNFGKYEEFVPNILEHDLYSEEFEDY